jgi:hypothetical protein
MHEQINECYISAMYFHTQNIPCSFLNFLSLETGVGASKQVLN